MVDKKGKLAEYLGASGYLQEARGSWEGLFVKCSDHFGNPFPVNC